MDHSSIRRKQTCTPAELAMVAIGYSPQEGIYLMDISVTLHTLRVLRLFLDNPGEELYTSQISKSTGLTPGTLTPMLRRLSRSGWMTSELGDEFLNPKGPPRRYWKLTEYGIEQGEITMKAARELLA